MTKQFYAATIEEFLLDDFCIRTILYKDEDVPMYEVYLCDWEFQELGDAESGPLLSRTQGPWKMIGSGMGLPPCDDQIVDWIFHVMDRDTFEYDGEPPKCDECGRCVGLYGDSWSCVNPECASGRESRKAIVKAMLAD